MLDRSILAREALVHSIGCKHGKVDQKSALLHLEIVFLIESDLN
jgi:hypothetical protein